MSISYPLVIPGVIGPSEANLKKYDAVGEFIGPFDGSAEQQQWQDQHWELDLVWPSMTRDQFSALDGFAGALHGKFGSFLWGPPLSTRPRGSGGLPVVRNVWPNPPGFTSITQGAGVATSIPPGSYYVFLQVQTKDGFFQTAEFGPITIDANHCFRLNWTSLPANVLQYLLYFGPISGGENSVINISVASMGPGVFITNGANAGSPLLANQPGSNSLSIGGLLPNQASILLCGDFFQLTAPDDNGISWQRLYQYINPNPLSTDGGGNAVLDIFPSIREAPANGSSVVLLNPAGTFRLAENMRESPAKSNKTFNFQLKAREAI